ncbi:hypothetical protein PGQ11_002504 [Apiospora arundinis]|uniref:Uncharacterized protein n=1 Tax=Apiospora arundinis TaxID=335852 RepID=A0ABR2JID3_9PEZI
MEFSSQTIGAGATPVASTNGGLQYKPRTAEEREADATRNAPKYARQKAVGSILTAKYLKAKAAFDTYFDYDLDAAFNGDDGSWYEDKDPWLRIRQTLPEFLEGYTQKKTAEDLTGEELESLATAVIRVARKDWEGAGRDAKVLDEAFVKETQELVQKLKTKHNLPESRPEADGADEEVEEEE